MKTCTLCNKPVESVYKDGDGITMYVDFINSKGISCGIRPIMDDDGNIQDLIHIDCAENAPEGAHFPFWL